MRIKAIETERYQDYKFPSLFIASCFCDFKCCTELGIDAGVCQNSPLANFPIKRIPDEMIYELYISNPITKAVVIGGMEPLMQIDEVEELIKVFRAHGDDSPFVIYTGYYPEEIGDELSRLRHFTNIFMKFGRFIPDRSHRFDDVLGVELSSDNQWAERLL